MKRNFLIFLVIAGLMSLMGYNSKRSQPAKYQHQGQQAPAGVNKESELPAGTYSCTAENTTRGDGPHSLICEKTGDELIIHFPKGIHVVTNISSEESEDNMTWNFVTTHTDSGDTWEVEITAVDL